MGLSPIWVRQLPERDPNEKTHFWKVIIAIAIVVYILDQVF